MATTTISEAAMRRLGSFLGPAGESAGSLRIFVDHRCHCGGLKHGMEFGRALDGDLHRELSGLTVLVAPEVEGEPGAAELDFSESLFLNRFTRTNSEHRCEWKSS